MIFNEMNNNVGVSYESVKESPYELGIGGALMHVYENECNYNAIMKAAALSELKYYNETGGDLFVQEAGALSSLLTRIKDFFKKVIEKIKSIAKKFFATINQYTMKDKDFVKKYQNDLRRRNLKDFEFDGYTFPLKAGNFSISSATKDTKGLGDEDADTINDIIEKNRGAIIGEGPLTESEYRDELKEKLYGDKEDFDVDINTQMRYILNTKDDIKDAEKAEKEITKNINAIVKKLEDDIKKADKEANSNMRNKKELEAKYDDMTVKALNTDVNIFKALSNDFTIYFGAYVEALKARNRQAKAICVKALSYKHEAASVYSESEYNIFAGVEIV